MDAHGHGSSAAPPQRSPWQSPVPYLFGGLAAVLGLIAFALVVLACSYAKLSGNFENRGDGEGQRDLEAAEDDDGEEKAAPAPAMQEKFLVIMAGQEKPTYLATPVSSSSRASSFGSKSSNSCCSCNTTSSEENEMMGNGEGRMGSRELPELQTQ